MERIKISLGFASFPTKFTCMGEDVSPSITVEGAKGKSMAMVMDDPDAPSGIYVHWVIWGMDILTNVPEGIPKGDRIEKPIKAVQGRNSARKVGYMGPCPPRGRPHRYYLKVYVLDSDLDLRPGSEKRDLEGAMDGHIVQYGETTATFGR
ncbi:MAG TPA: YbhB/YbcL family Raf kinase inhibitor-like protein [Methanomassiliicoccales archaeon]|nr:YbhB/YbcL family Raf kinase inhibitor-like protein [Methanomassiliicoccales archaeon]